MSKFSILFACVTLFFGRLGCVVRASITYTGAALQDQVDWATLPGTEKILPDLTFNAFSGYLSVDGEEVKSKKLHYWLVESQSAMPESDPVAFWTNGGPGCSGMLGMMTEHGPLKMMENGELTLNPYSHTLLSNILFVEQPVGVGFSYSEYVSDYNSSDATAATDNYNLLLAFMERFPHFVSSDLYITSESYGGHYMPTLAREILTQNDIGVNPTLTFKGFLVGNPYVSFYSGVGSMLDTFWYRSLVAQPVWESFQEHCPEEWFREPLQFNGEDDDFVSDAQAEACNEVLTALITNAQFKTNVYAIDWPVCPEGSPLNRDDDESLSHSGMSDSDSVSKRRRHLLADYLSGANRVHRRQGQRLLSILMETLSSKLERARRTSAAAAVAEGAGERSMLQLPLVQVKMSSGQEEDNHHRQLFASLEEDGVSYNACEDWWILDWFNRDEVKAALHVKASINWRECARPPFYYNETDVLLDVVPIYREVLAHPAAQHLKILIFSGTDDSVCSTSGTQGWVYDLGYNIDPDMEWLPYTVDNQQAGYVTGFLKTPLKFATVLNAGHEVPTYRPRESLALWRAYLTDAWASRDTLDANDDGGSGAENR